jgi:DNA-binding XRE family transcriptional regulator
MKPRKVSLSPKEKSPFRRKKRRKRRRNLRTRSSGRGFRRGRRRPPRFFPRTSVASERSLGLSQADLAEAIGTDQAAVGLIETRRSNPTLRTIENIARVLRTTVPEP